MKKTIDQILMERDELADLLEDVVTRLQELRLELDRELEDLEDMITEH